MVNIFDCDLDVAIHKNFCRGRGIQNLLETHPIGSTTVGLSWGGAQAPTTHSPLKQKGYTVEPRLTDTPQWQTPTI